MSHRAAVAARVRDRARSAVPLLAVLLPAVLLVSGCTPASESAVRAAAQRFQSAVGSGDAAAACAMLSEETRSSLELASAQPCPRALTALRLPSGRPSAVEVWGDNGQARLADGALFLSEFPTGWKITAAGCHPRRDKPYACAVRS